MSNLFEQYEEASSRGYGSRQRHNQAKPVTSSGYISTRAEEDVPIFSKQRVNFRPPNTVTKLIVCNNFLVMAMTKELFRLDMERPDNPDEMTLASPAAGDRVHNIFLDPTGRHLLINMELSQETYYLSRSSKKPKNLTKLKGMLIESVGWNKQNTSENNTGPILIGNKKGQIFETDIQSGDSSTFFMQNLEQYFKELTSLGVDQPITSIEFERMPTQSKTQYKYFILVTTPGRLYQYVGDIPTLGEPPMFQPIFKKCENVEGRFLELPGDFGTSQLKLYYSKYRGVPSSFAWMTGPGVYYGNIDMSGASGQDSVTVETKLMQYPSDDKDHHAKHPLSIVVTEFHVLVLYADRMQAICVLNDQLVFEDLFTDKFGKLLGLCHDLLRGTIWAYTEAGVFKYKVTKETRDVWQMYLDKNDFVNAKEFCKNNPAQLDKVMTKEAEQLFKEKKYHESAILYAQTQNSFEDITLRFLQVEDKHALKDFLVRRLNALQPAEKTQVTMLVTWLVEIYLNQLGQLKEKGEDETSSYAEIQDEFRKFLAQTKIKDCVEHNRETIYELIASHGDVPNMVYFAVFMHDYERVIGHYIQHEDYAEALKVIMKQPKIELVYKFSPILMQNIPKDTVDAWITLGRRPDPKKLIPSLVQCDHVTITESCNEAARYLEFAVYTLDNKDPAIHNYLLSVYAKLYPDKLMVYLNKQGEDPDDVSYDLKYALRLCLEHNLKEACVHIYSTMGLYEEAVELALQFDIDIAKKNANRPEDDEELKKKLWLRIARHVVEEQRDIKRAMEFLHECEHLKIEDILPFFPDFVTIDHFKDAICTSLEEYNEHIQNLQEEMNEATDSAKDIRSEIQAFRNKYAFVHSQEKCSVCSFPLLTRSFYVFPCMHKFHTDCLVTEILPHLSISKRNQVEDIQRRIGHEVHNSQTSHLLKSELEELIANECVYCGEIMIRCIDKPFIEDDEYNDVVKSWL